MDTKRIPGISGIEVNDDGGFTIGAGTPMADIGEHAALAAAWPGVAEATRLIGSA